MFLTSVSVASGSRASVRCEVGILDVLSSPWLGDKLSLDSGPHQAFPVTPGIPLCPSLSWTPALALWPCVCPLLAQHCWNHRSCTEEHVKIPQGHERAVCTAAQLLTAESSRMACTSTGGGQMRKMWGLYTTLPQRRHIRAVCRKTDASWGHDVKTDKPDTQLNLYHRIALM